MDPNFHQFVKASLGPVYDKYFTNQLSHDGTTRAATSHECFHYNDVLYDEQLCDVQAYTDNKEPHAFSLLRRFIARSRDSQAVVTL